MKLLLDECTPKRLILDFTGHDVQTVEQTGFKGLKNGELLQQASSDFDVLITVDQNIPFQQNAANLGIAVVILKARSNRYSDLRTLVPRVLEILPTISAGEIVIVRQDSDLQRPSSLNGK
jgi:predicted nuclease of predicted toxin-antitoxin system